MSKFLSRFPRNVLSRGVRAIVENLKVRKAWRCVWIAGVLLVWNLLTACNVTFALRAFHWTFFLWKLCFRVGCAREEGSTHTFRKLVDISRACKTAIRERTCFVSEDYPTRACIIYLTDGDWKISVTTGALPECGTTANVVLVACADDGSNSGPVFLGNGAKGLFQPATTERFKVRDEVSAQDIASCQDLHLVCMECWINCTKAG